MQISDIVDLIIDKKVSVLEERLSKVSQEMNKIKDSRYDRINHIELMEHIGKKYKFAGRRRMSFDSGSRRDESDSYEKDWFFRQLAFYLTENDDDSAEREDSLRNEVDDLEHQIRDIKESRDEITAKVTLLKLAEIDIDFSNNIDELSERIFKNNLIY